MSEREAYLADLLAREADPSAGEAIDRAPLSPQEQERLARTVRCLARVRQARPEPSEVVPPEVLDLLRQEAQLRREAGLASDLSEYARAYPHLAPLLAELPETVPWSAPREPTSRLPEIADYQILGILGRGGMSVVYLARQVSLKRLVAIKVLPGHLADLPDRRLRFQAEAEVIARFRHPGIIQIHAVGWVEDTPYLVLEFAAGGSLAQRLQAQPQPPAAAARCVEQLAEIVQAIHAAGLIHRDLKPGNILLESPATLADAVYRVSDFGLSRDVTREGSVTQTGQILGTPAYMAPEQVAGQAVGPALDIWALGVILYELLTGIPPFQAPLPPAILQRIQNEEPVPPRRLQPGIPRDLEVICLKCLEKEPANRYATAQALADDLGRLRRGEPIHARPPGPVGRAVRWVRRQPTLAALLGTIILSLFVGLSGLIAFTFWLDAARQDANRVAETARINANRATEQEAEARNQARRAQSAAYTAYLRGVQAEVARPVWPQRFRQLDDAPELLRGWEHAWAVRRYQRNLAIYPHPNQQRARPIAYSADGRTVAAPDVLGVIHLWNPADGSARRLPHPNGTLDALAFSPDGKRLCSCDRNGLVIVWDLETLQQLRTARIAPDVCAAAAWLPGTSRVLFAIDKSVVAFDANTGAVGPDLLRHEQPVTGLAFSPDSCWLAVVGRDAGVEIYDAKTLKLARKLPSRMGFDHVAWASDSLTLVAGGSLGHVVVWRLPNEQPVTTLREEPGWAIYGLALPTPDSVASVSSDLILRLWSLDRKEAVLRWRGHSAWLAGHPSRPQVVTRSRDGLLLWNVELPRAPRSITGPSDECRTLAVSPDESTLAVTWHPNRIRLIDARTSRLLRELPGHPTGVMALAFSADGQTLFSAGLDNTIRRWEVASSVPVPKERAIYPGHLNSVLTLAVRDNLLASAGDNLRVHILDTVTGERLATLDNNARTLAFDPTGNLLATGNQEGLVRVIDWRSGRVVVSFPVTDNNIGQLEWSPDGRHLAVAGMGREIQVWNLEHQVPRAFAIDEGSLRRFAINWSSRRLMAIDFGKALHVWDLDSTEELLTVPFSDPGPGDLVFLPSSSRILAAGVGGVFHFEAEPVPLR